MKSRTKEEEALSLIKQLRIQLDKDDDDDTCNTIENAIENAIPSPLQFNQGQLVEFMSGAQSCSWDIPETLGKVCICNGVDFFMHRNEFWNNDWSATDWHFKEVHNLDLTDARIDWGFDT